MKQIVFILSLAIPLPITGMIIDRSKNVVSRERYSVPVDQPEKIKLIYSRSKNRKPPMPNLRLEHLSSVLWPVTRFETENTILFYGPRKVKDSVAITIKASRNKATGKISAAELCKKMIFKTKVQSETLWSPYKSYPEETYNALQALYEKQQADAGNQAEERDQEESKAGNQ